MCRPLRIEYPGAVYHVTSRGNRRSHIFTDGEDRNTFFNILTEVNRRFETRCHAYCLMGNHYHLLLETPRGNLSIAMRQLNGVYTQTYNRLHCKCGHLLQGRYKAVLVQKDSHLVEAARYIVRNPVRAGLVKDPAEWPWSSYAATAGLAKPDVWLTTEWLLAQFGNSPESARKNYIDYVMEGPDEDMKDEVLGGVVFGSEEYAVECLSHARGDGDMEEVSRKQRFADRPGLDAIMAGPGEKAEKVLRAVEVYGYTQKAVSVELGVHYSAVSKLLSRRMSRFKT